MPENRQKEQQLRDNLCQVLKPLTFQTIVLAKLCAEKRPANPLQAHNMLFEEISC